MLDEDETPLPKPLVEYIMLPEEEEEHTPDIFEKYEKNHKIPLDKLKGFGKDQDFFKQQIRDEIHEFHKVKLPEDKFIPYDIDLEEDPGLVGPSIPKDFTHKAVEKNIEMDDYSDQDEEEEEEPIDKRVPATHVVELMHAQGKLLNSIDIDRNHADRMVTGSHDGTIKIWDFNGMTRRPEAFTTVDAGEGLPVYAVSFSLTGG